ncbi:MAG: glycoside hydrolase family 88 protein [Acidobacteriaceae bacterium]
MRGFPRGALKLSIALLLPVSTCLTARANNRSDSKHKSAETSSYIGDAPAIALPLATDLSPVLTKKAIDRAVRKVGDWELRRSQIHFRQDWRDAVLYAGFMAAANALPDRKYQTAMLRMGNRFDWQLNPVAPGRKDLADNHAIGQTYLTLYRIYRQPKMIAPTEAKFDALMRVPDDPAHPVWWWADAIFMGPPTWVRLYQATGNKAYLDYMNREFWITSNLLYQPKERLYSRDATYLNKRSGNGQRLFWSRGNGWVLAGIARILQDMPADYPSRPKYVERFRQMAAEIASLQGADGLWRADLLDPDAYPAPEVSGSALFVYAMVWGIDHDILDRATYLSVVQKGWRGLLSHIYQDGRLGSIQPVGSEPLAFPPTSSYVYGVGAFLLAGAELHRLAEQK